MGYYIINNFNLKFYYSLAIIIYSTIYNNNIVYFIIIIIFFTYNNNSIMQTEEKRKYASRNEQSTKSIPTLSKIEQKYAEKEKEKKWNYNNINRSLLRRNVQ